MSEIDGSQFVRHRLDEGHARQLLIRYQAGDRAAAEELVSLLSPPIFRFLWYRGLSREQHDDLLQDFWLQVHKSRHTFRVEAPVLPWLYAIARHVRSQAYRRHRSQANRESQATPVEHRVTFGPGDANLLDMLAELPESQREVLWMLKGAGMSLAEVAAATSSTIGAVKQKAHRAYESLRYLLKGSKA